MYRAIAVPQHIRAFGCRFLGIAIVVITGFMHTIANGLFPVSQEEVDRYRYLYDKLEAESTLPPYLKRF
jgi:hypothetical protein